MRNVVWVHGFESFAMETKVNKGHQVHGCTDKKDEHIANDHQDFMPCKSHFHVFFT